MHRHARIALAATLGLGLLTPPACRAKPGTNSGPPSTQPAAAARDRILKFKHLSVDLNRRQILLETAVCLRQGALELLVCKTKTKEHESILRTDASAAHLHAGLLALGLMPGKPAEWSEQEKPRFLPPRGAAVEIKLRWKDKKGNFHEVDPSAWLALAETGPKTAAPKSWVFVGSDILASGAYWADVDGDVISVSNFASAVIDVPFESSEKNTILNFQANTAAIPPLNTPVQVVLQPLPDQDKAAHARATLYVDRLGRLRQGGQALTQKDLCKWAEQYVSRHAKGRVVIRAEPLAVAHDIALVKRELEIAGVRDIRVEHWICRDGLLPRTRDEAERAVRQWQQRLAKRDRLPIDPLEEARQTLARIRADLARATEHREVLSQYARDLEEALRQYRASTRPADTEGRGQGE